MNAIEQANGQIDPDALWLALQELEAGEMEPQRRDELMALIQRSEPAQDAYLEYFEMSAMITSEAETSCEQSCLPESSIAFKPRRSRKLIGLAAAAALILGLLITQLIQPQEATIRLSAEIIPGTVWEVNGQAANGQTSQLDMAAGSSIQVISGTVRLTNGNGTEMLLQGPARATLRSANQALLHRGWMWVDAEGSTHGFEVETASLRLRDIGTRFGVHVSPGMADEVHLVEGRVDAISKPSGQKIASLDAPGQGFSVSTTEEPLAIEMAYDPFPLFEQTRDTPASYQTTILSQSPTGYWPGNTEDRQQLTNQVIGGLSGHLHPTLEAGAKGPRPSGGFTGFERSNRAISLNGKVRWAPISLGTSPTHSDLLFEEHFSGTGALNRQQPDLSIAKTKWIATDAFRANGHIDPKSTGTATLAFTPVDGVIYTLDASFKDIDTSSSANGWVALAFASGQSISSKILGPHENRFIEGRTTGRAWMIYRGPDTLPSHEAMLGTTGKNGGMADLAIWEDVDPESSGNIDLRVVLDTTGGSGHWTATWQAKSPGQSDYLVVRPTTKLLNEEIRSIGIGVGKPGVSGKVSYFSLRAESHAAQPHGEWLADQPAPIQRQQGTISLWLKMDPDRQQDQIIWSAATSALEDSIHLRVSRSGQLGLFIENNSQDILCSSDVSLSDDRWHHLVATWGSRSAAIHLDGKEVASDTEFEMVSPGKLPVFSFGSGPLNSSMAPLTGSIDEIAIWNRSLTGEEIEHQFSAATSGQ